jgi:hypothetical protein
MIFDDAYRLSRERLIAAEFRPGNWRNSLEKLVDGVAARFTTAAEPGPLAAPIALGRIYRFGTSHFAAGLDRDAAIAEMLRFDDAWHAVEDDTVWSKAVRARLGFQAPAPLPGGLMVFLKVRAATNATELVVRVAGTVVSRVVLSRGERRLLRLDLGPHVLEPLAKAGLPVTLTLAVGHLSEIKVRKVGIGVELFMACAAGDLDARLSIVEDALMTFEHPFSVGECA